MSHEVDALTAASMRLEMVQQRLDEHLRRILDAWQHADAAAWRGRLNDLLHELEASADALVKAMRELSEGPEAPREPTTAAAD